MTKCKGVDRRGNPCKFPAWDGSPYCTSCIPKHPDDPAVTDAVRESAHRERVHRGEVGRAKAMANKAERKTMKLRSTGDLLTELERAAIAVVRSGADAIAKSGAMTKIVSEARAVLKAELLEKENAELKTLLLERHPELKKHLKAVS